MTRTIQILLVFISLNAFAQETDTIDTYRDSVLANTEEVFQLNQKDIGTILIFNFIYENGYGEAKGFIVVEEDSLNTNCSQDCDTKLKIESYNDSLFIINYKNRHSKDFIIDTCYLYRNGNNYMAYPMKLNSSDVTEKTINSWIFGPSSSEERDVVRFCFIEGRDESFCAF